VFVDVDQAVASCSELARLPVISAESRARLATIEGLLRSLVPASIPAFNVRAPVDVSFTYRVAEVIDDAHCLEASALRVFFSAASNRRAITRDLRKLLQLVLRGRHWARASLALGKHLVSPFSAQVAQEALGILGLPTNDRRGILIVKPSPLVNRDYVAVTGRPSLYFDHWIGFLDWQ
jgi:hypothetical protein